MPPMNSAFSSSPWLMNFNSHLVHTSYQSCFGVTVQGKDSSIYVKFHGFLGDHHSNLLITAKQFNTKGVSNQNSLSLSIAIPRVQLRLYQINHVCGFLCLPCGFALPRSHSFQQSCPLAGLRRCGRNAPATVQRWSYPFQDCQ